MWQSQWHRIRFSTLHASLPLTTLRQEHACIREGKTDVEVQQELTFHAVARVRVQRLFNMLDDCQSKFVQRIFVICDETSRTLALYFQRAS